MKKISILNGLIFWALVSSTLAMVGEKPKKEEEKISKNHPEAPACFLEDEGDEEGTFTDEGSSIGLFDTNKRLAERINIRGYLRMVPYEFEAIAGESRGMRSLQYNNLMDQLKTYMSLKDNYEREENEGEKHLLKVQLEEQLGAIATLTSQYLTTERLTFDGENKKSKPDPETQARLTQRINACELLLNGIQEEQGELHLDMDNSVLSQPYLARRFDFSEIEKYQSKFAGGMVSDITKFEAFGKELVFKESSRIKQLSELNAKQLGFSSAITFKKANIAGRAVATWAIDNLFQRSKQKALVPKTRFAAIGPKGSEKKGICQHYIPGKQLYEESKVKISAKDYEEIGFLERAQFEAYLTAIALGSDLCPSGCQLSFPANFIQVNPEKALINRETNKPIGEKKALELAQKDQLYLEFKHVLKINEEINFKSPSLQKALANINLLHKITGELDPNPLNFIYTNNNQGEWWAYTIDHDFSFPSYFREVDDVSIRNMINERELGYIPFMPSLIDEEMGEATLALTAEELELELTNAKLEQQEIDAAKSRLFNVQQHIREIKKHKGYVLFWGEETYNLAIEDPQTNYLGRAVEVRAKKRQEKGMFQTQLNIKLELLKEQIRDCVDFSEREKLQGKIEEVEEELNEFTKSSIEDEHSMRDEGRYSGSFSHFLDRSRMTLVGGFLPFLDRLWYLTDQFRSNQPSFCREWMPFLQDMDHPFAAANKMKMFAEQEMQKVQSRFDEMVKTVFLQEYKKNIESIDKIWKTLINDYREAINAWDKTLNAYKKELGGQLSDKDRKNRESLLEGAIQKQASLIVDSLWAEVYHKEHLALVEFCKESKPTSGYLTKLAELQLAWNALMNHFPLPFKRLSSGKPNVLSSPEDEVEYQKWQQPWHQELWGNKFKQAESFSEVGTPIFRWWLPGVKKRYEAAIVSSVVDLKQRNEEEAGLWNQRETEFIDSTEEVPADSQHLWSSIIHEGACQKCYVAARIRTTDSIELKNKINALAAEPIVETETHIANLTGLFGLTKKVYVELIDIVGADQEKLSNLCQLWDRLLQNYQLKEELNAWEAFFEASHGHHTHDESLLKGASGEMLAGLLKFRLRQIEPQIDTLCKNVEQALAQIEPSKELGVAPVHRHRLDQCASPIDNVQKSSPCNNLEPLIKELAEIKTRCSQAMDLGNKIQNWRPIFYSMIFDRIDEKMIKLVKDEKEKTDLKESLGEQPEKQGEKKEEISERRSTSRSFLGSRIINEVSLQKGEVTDEENQDGFLLIEHYAEHIMESFLNRIDEFNAPNVNIPSEPVTRSTQLEDVLLAATGIEMQTHRNPYAEYERPLKEMLNKEPSSMQKMCDALLEKATEFQERIDHWLEEISNRKRTASIHL